MTNVNRKTKQGILWQRETPQGFVSMFENTEPDDDAAEDTTKQWDSEDYDAALLRRAIEEAEWWHSDSALTGSAADVLRHEQRLAALKAELEKLEGS